MHPERAPRGAMRDRRSALSATSALRAVSSPVVRGERAIEDGAVDPVLEQQLLAPRHHISGIRNHPAISVRCSFRRSRALLHRRATSSPRRFPLLLQAAQRVDAAARPTFASLVQRRRNFISCGWYSSTKDW